MGDQIEWRYETFTPVGGRYEDSRVGFQHWCAAPQGLVKSLTVRGTALDEQGKSLPGPVWNIPEETALTLYDNGGFFGPPCYYPGKNNSGHTGTSIRFPINVQKVDSMKYEVWLNEPDLYQDPYDPGKIRTPKFPVRPPDYQVVRYYGWERM
ncbi:MAG: hypothetical protein AAB338_01695 [Patescibacteria group bacterium]